VNCLRWTTVSQILALIFFFPAKRYILIFFPEILKKTKKKWSPLNQNGMHQWSIPLAVSTTNQKQNCSLHRWLSCFLSVICGYPHRKPLFRIWYDFLTFLNLARPTVPTEMKKYPMVTLQAKTFPTIPILSRSGDGNLVFLDDKG
jgi:hypothetical protein